MEELAGRVAVVTGGAGSIGRAMGEGFAREDMLVVLADVETGPLADAEGKLRSEGLEVTGVECDVSDFASVERLADRTLELYGAVHLLCNNAGIGAGAEGALREHAQRLALGVQRQCLRHHPRHQWLGADHDRLRRRRTHRQHLLGQRRCFTAPRHSPIICDQGGGGDPHRGLYAQLEDAGSRIGASVLFSGPHMLRTGIFGSWRVRPQELAKEPARQSPYPTVEDIEHQMSAAGIEVEVHFTEPAEVADQVVREVRAGAFWIMAPSEQVHADPRSSSLDARTNQPHVPEGGPGMTNTTRDAA